MISSLFKTNFIKPIAKIYLKNRFYNLDRFSYPSFSQMGEDMILKKIFENQEKGFYVDIGAYHPKQHSNTYYFYINGWRGINVDAMPGSMSEFKKYRPRDINIEVGISDKKEQTYLYIFNQPALNTVSHEIALKKENETTYKIINKKKIKTDKLGNVLKKYLPKNTIIDLLSIDVEGIDYLVLVSNNWDIFRPRVIVIEDSSFILENFKDSRIYNFLINKGYIFLAKTDVSLIFKDKKF